METNDFIKLKIAGPMAGPKELKRKPKPTQEENILSFSEDFVDIENIEIKDFEDEGVKDDNKDVKEAKAWALSDGLSFLNCVKHNCSHIYSYATKITPKINEQAGCVNYFAQGNPRAIFHQSENLVYTDDPEIDDQAILVMLAISVEKFGNNGVIVSGQKDLVERAFRLAYDNNIELQNKEFKKFVEDQSRKHKKLR